jgi:hypothetical protein
MEQTEIQNVLTIELARLDEEKDALRGAGFTMSDTCYHDSLTAYNAMRDVIEHRRRTCVV